MGISSPLLRKYAAITMFVVIVAALGGGAWANAQSGTTSGTGSTTGVTETVTVSPTPATATPVQSTVTPTVTMSPTPDAHLLIREQLHDLQASVDGLSGPLLVFLNNLALGQSAMSQRLDVLTARQLAQTDDLVELRDMVNSVAGVPLVLDELRNNMNTVLLKLENAPYPSQESWDLWFQPWDQWQADQQLKTQELFDNLLLWDERNQFIIEQFHLALALLGTPVPAPVSGPAPSIGTCNGCQVGGS